MRLAWWSALVLIALYAACMVGLAFWIGNSGSRAPGWPLMGAAVGLGLIVAGVLFLQAQFVGRANRLARVLEASIAAEPVQIPPMEAEFAPVTRAVERVQVALSAARTEESAASRRIGALSDVLRVGLLWFRPNREVDFANRRAMEMIGAEGIEGVQKAWEVIGVSALEAMERLQKGGGPHSETIGLTFGEVERRLKLQLYRVDADGSDGFIGLLTDPDLIETLEGDVRLAAQMQSLSRIYRTVVHELRSPLSAIIMNMDLLRDTLAEVDSDDKALRDLQKRTVGIVQEELTRLNKALLEMLTQFQPHAAKAERIDLRALVGDLAMLVEQQARSQGVAVKTELPSEPIIVMGHPDRLKQALLNVIINALEAMPKGGALAFTTGARDGAARVELRDTGPGLAEGEFERIFEMGWSTKNRGTGTGLHVAKTLVEQHGGQIRARNVPRQGAAFEIVLPMASPSM